MKKDKMAEIQWKCNQWEVNIMFLNNFFFQSQFSYKYLPNFILFSDLKVSAKSTYAIFSVMYDIKNWNHVNIVLRVEVEKQQPAYGSQIAVQISGYISLNDSVSHASLENSKSLLHFIAGQFTLRLCCLHKSMWIVNKSNHNVNYVFLHEIFACWKHFQMLC